MRRSFASNLGFALAALGTTSPAWAGVIVAPVPEVAGGLLAVAMLGVGYRLLRKRFMR